MNLDFLGWGVSPWFNCMETLLICLLKRFLYKRQIKEENGAQRVHKHETKEKIQVALSETGHV